MKFAKKELDRVRFKYNELNFEVSYEGHGNCSKYISWKILGDLIISEPYHVKFFFMNFLHSP